ncbi:MAG: enolase C-terminal domain-like protein, partial [Haloarculaceae archaeon]
MEITAVDAYPVTVGVVDVEEGGIAPYVTNHGQVEAVDRLVVRVETDTGLVGWGEMRTFLSPAATRTVLEDGIAPWVVGRSPYEVETLRRQLFVEYTNADMFFAPVEMACWDIVGKDLGKPVYELLGGWTAPDPTGRTASPDTGDDADLRVDAAYCVGILPPDESREHARRALDAGYAVLKTKAGRDWRQDVERVVAMDAAVDGRLDFRLDPNQGWSLEEA